MATTGTIEQYGFWALLALMLVRDLVIPLTNKIVPAKVKAGISIEERQVLALENSNKVSAQLAEILRQHEGNFQTIIKSLTEQGKTLAVLLDREAKKTARAKKQ